MDDYKEKLISFIENKELETEILGMAQASPIKEDDNYLELIPQNYLDNTPLGVEEINEEMKNIYKEIIFQKIREEN
ncbi:hypothetical protein I6J18_12640 [Peribacillus psychrosaccharolyticus]|uniref:Uncharacterized protein n=1 Tax=Peribacillus psychrosaccharolyticus TaxID=1407 RepID=A0A974RYM4_PERPY|nr:hypothetical protein [Peribacillus psychrosaccharolyticus]MEC2057661.1 hypothetical protein [Peribacillus psychrosaccharolyticus]MED3744807.1 hypothetical protein [Peribacillus psychrosaccharolyticus]QQS98598.1 hypothetical protein I6J18_12640 [Peribacillus psychrosaccharolyticus]